VETLAAMLFMAIVIPVALQGILVANRAGVVAERKRVAARLADNLLTEMVITDNWRDGDTAGDFADDWPDYKWIVEDEAWEEDTMRVLSVRVLYRVQEREYEVKLSTLVPEEPDEEVEEATQ
jgi:type II secretory pathway pseudopilin PulG